MSCLAAPVLSRKAFTLGTGSLALGEHRQLPLHSQPIGFMVVQPRGTRAAVILL